MNSVDLIYKDMFCHVCLETSEPLLLTCKAGTCHGFLVHPACYVDMGGRGIDTCTACGEAYNLHIVKKRGELVCVHTPRACQTMCVWGGLFCACVALASGLYFTRVYGGVGVWVCCLVVICIVGFLWANEPCYVPCRRGPGSVSVEYI